MPVYVFECPKGHVIEQWFALTDKPKVKCHCGAKTKKIVAPCGFVTSNLVEARDASYDRAYHRQRQENEWAVALGRDVDRNGAATSTNEPTAPTLSGIQDKKEALKRGAQVPKRFKHLTNSKT